MALSLQHDGVSGTRLEALLRRPHPDASVTNVVLPFDGDFDRLRRILARWGWEVGERPNAPVYGEGPSVTLHAYRTGKLMLSGKRAREYAEALATELPGPGPGPGPGPTGQRPPGPAQGARQDQERGWLLHFDGACLPRNPGGVAAYGFVVHRDGALVHEGHGLASPPGPGATNNVAEFTGLVQGLLWLKAHARRGEPIRVRGDSRLAIDGVVGLRKIHVLHLKPLAAQARQLVEETGAKLEWVPREQNAHADRMSEIGVEEAMRAHPEWRL